MGLLKFPKLKLGAKIFDLLASTLKGCGQLIFFQKFQFFAGSSLLVAPSVAQE